MEDAVIDQALAGAEQTLREINAPLLPPVQPQQPQIRPEHVVALVESRVQEALGRVVPQIAAAVSTQPTPAGRPGRDGVNGVNGRNGRDGRDGKDGKDIVRTLVRIPDTTRLAESDGSSLVGYKLRDTGTVARTVEEKLSDIKAREDYGGTAGQIRLGINGTAPTSNILRILTDNDNANDLGVEVAVFIRRTVSVDEGFTNPKALRVSTEVDASTAQNEWAISGDVDMNVGATGAGNVVAVSGVTNRYSPTTTNTAFGGHFQVKDHNEYAAADDVAPIVGVEMNLNAYGPDHTTANSNRGRRIVQQIIAKNNSEISATDTEIGRGLRISNESGANNGYFRIGLSIEEAASNTNPITTAVKIDTTGERGIHITGATTIADIQLAGNSAYGLICNGTYTNAAIRVADDQYIGLRSNNTARMRFVTSTAMLEFEGASTARAAFELDASARLLLNGTQVLQGQGAAVADATDAPSVITQLNALLARCRAHGLIAT